MSAIIDVDTSGFSLNLVRFVTLTGSDARASARRAARSFARHLLAITPPGDGAQSGERAALTKDDQRRAEAAIAGDLAVLFAPVRLKGTRPEEWPDVAGLHRHAFITGKTPGKRIKRVGNVKYVDQKKLRALMRTLFAAVGRLAAHWLAAAMAIGAKGIPQWVSRHGALGLTELSDPSDPHFHFALINPSVPTSIADELHRRAGYAAFYASKGLDRQLHAILVKRGQQFSNAHAA